MKNRRLILILLLISLPFAACTGKPAAPSGTDPAPSSPTKLTPLSTDEIAELQEIYEPAHNFYNTALGLEFSNPRDISLSSFFHQGDYDEIALSEMTDDEYTFIRSGNHNAEYLSWYRISSQDVERILQMCFGISLSDMNKNDLSSLLYWDKTDCYYSGTTSPGPSANNLEITGGFHLEDGNLEVHYRNSQSDKIVWEYYVMILKPVDGGYHILSNLEVKE